MRYLFFFILFAFNNCNNKKVNNTFVISTKRNFNILKTTLDNWVNIKSESKNKEQTKLRIWSVVDSFKIISMLDIKINIKNNDISLTENIFCTNQIFDSSNRNKDIIYCYSQDHFFSFVLDYDIENINLKDSLKRLLTDFDFIRTKDSVKYKKEDKHYLYPPAFSISYLIEFFEKNTKYTLFLDEELLENDSRFQLLSNFINTLNEFEMKYDKINKKFSETRRCYPNASGFYEIKKSIFN